MKRTKTNETSKRERLAARIMAAVDRAIASPLGPRRGNRGAAVECVTGMILAQDAMEFEHWPIESLRALLFFYTQIAPLRDLEIYAERADDQLSWVGEYELQDEFERSFGVSCYGEAYKVWRKGRESVQAVAS